MRSILLPGYLISAVFISERIGVIPLPAARKKSCDVVSSIGRVKRPEAPMESN